MKPQCAHLCAKFCMVLDEAVRRETAAVEYYKTIVAECDFPEVGSFVQRLIAEREGLVASLHRKIEEVQAARDITASIGGHLA